jgi:hypothetical protein
MPFREELVSILDDLHRRDQVRPRRRDETYLMPAADEVEIMLLKEPGNDVRAEGERDTTAIFSPPMNISVGVRPAEESCQYTLIAQ